MSFQVIATVGPSSLDAEILKRINLSGRCIFRINGAHVDREGMAQNASVIRAAIPDARIMIDLPGNKVRTRNLIPPVRLTRGNTFLLNDYQVNYPDFYKHLKVGDRVYANDSIYELEVTGFEGSAIRFLSHSDGVLETRKGLHLRGVSDNLPFLFEHDLDLIEGARELGLDIVSLSFVRNADDVRTARRQINSDSIQVFAKIETAQALTNLHEILDCVDTVNIDRGDLSADIGLINVAAAQKSVIKTVLERNKSIFLATQFLKSMENNPIPLIAEILGIYEAAHSGIAGIQLSEETAVGKYPVQCVELIFEQLKQV